MADGFGLKEMLDGRIAAARRALSGPARLRAFAPLGLWLAFFLCFWLSGLYTAMPLETQALAGIVFWLGAIAGVWLVTQRWRKPTEEDARDLIDASIEGRPMEAWADKPTRVDELGLKLWLTHRDRMGALAKDAKHFNVSPYWKKADPAYLRFATPVLLVAALAVANIEAPARLKAGLAPDFGALFGAHKLTFEAFLAPPSYSGDPPIVLKPNVSVETAEGSIVTLRMLSPGGKPTVVINPDSGRTVSLHPGPDPVDGSYQAVIQVDRPMRIAVDYWGTRGYYDLKIKADAAPKIEFTAPPKLADGDLTEFEYKASDDYGVAKIALVVRPKTLPKDAATTKGARLEDVTEIELQGFEPKEETGKQALDMVRNRYAGLDVMVKLRATDAAGHKGESAEVEYKLPRKIFLQPNARAAQEIREKIMQEWRPYAPPAKDDRFSNSRRTGLDNINTAASSRLEKAPEGVKTASTMLEALTYQPQDYFVDPMIFIGLAQSKAIIATAQTMEEAEYAEGILWSTALLAEYGSLSDATAALEAARRALEEALRNGASDEEIKRLMDMFEQAVENYLAARMAEALKNGRVSDGDQPQQGGGRQGMQQPMDGDELQRMLDALRDMSANGARDQARALLNQMQQTLDRLQNMQLQVSRGQSGQNGQQRNDVMNRALNRALQETNRTLNDQRDLNDATEQAERQGANPQRGQQLADQQRQLRERLEQQMRSGGGQPQQGQQGQQQGQRGQQGQQGQGQQGQQGQGQQGQQGQGQQGQQGQGQQGQGQQGQGQQGQGQGGQQGQGQMGQGTQPGQGQQGQGMRGQPRPGQPGQPGQQGQRGNQFGQSGPPGVDAGPGQGGQETERSRHLLAQAIEAARRSEEALRRGDFAAAQQAQQDTMAALQGRASELARAADESDPDQAKKEADPLGRLSDGTSGSGDNVKVPDEIDRQRVRDIFDELRRRASDRTLPQQEQDYLRRLLDVFTR